MALPKAKEDALAARLAALPALSGKGWLAAARGDALARLAAMGLPARRDEYWRYTDPASLNAPEVAVAHRFDDSDEAAPFEGMDRLKIVFVDGVFDPAASDDLALSGVTIERLAAAGTKDIHWAQGLFGVLEARGQTPVARPFAALNTAHATDGILIHVTGKATKPVSLIYVHKSDTSDAILHHCVKLEPGAHIVGPAWIGHGSVVCAGARLTRSVLFEYTRIPSGMHFEEMMIARHYCVDRHGKTVYRGDDSTPLRGGDARG